MSAFLITTPDHKGGLNVWLCRDILPPRWGKKGEYPGAVLVKSYTDSEEAEIDAMSQEQKLDWLLAEARHKSEMKVAA